MPKSQRGFTLIELLLALAVLATAIGMAVPAAQGYIQRSSDASICHELRHELVAARQQAIDSRRVTSWDTAFLERRTESKLAGYSLEVSPERPVQFRPDGTASDAVVVVIHHESESIVGRIIVVGSTGAILTQAESRQ